MNKSISKSTSDNLIDLYTRIPDYSEVQHLGQSDFINTLERLKEEFRQCRASLYNEEFCSDSEYLAGKSSPITNHSRLASSRPSDNLYYCSSSSKFANNNFTAAGESKSSCGGGLGFSFDDGHGKATKINNHNLTTTATTSTFKDNGGVVNEEEGTAGSTRGGGGQYLSIKSCELHRTPYRTSSASSLTQPGRYAGNYGARSFLLRGVEGDSLEGHGCGKNNRNYLDDDDYEDDDDDDEEYKNNDNRRLGRNDRAWSVGSLNSDFSISKWSSSPEIYRSRSRSKEYFPPSNVEQRMLQRKSQNNSAPSVAFKDQPEEISKPTFKANPVPDHVYKPLYEFIMLKNQRRSERIREQSKRRLLSQVKPFSFYKDSTNNRSHSSNHPSHHVKIANRTASESLNNTKPLKKKRNDSLGNVKTNNNKLCYNTSLFKAKPAPPRTKALLAAIRQKEQQEYRELKKRLRSETLLKNACLPPSMAAREKRTKITNAKIDEVLHEYQKSFAEDSRKGRRNYRETSAGTDDTGLLTDDDRITDEDFSGLTTRTKKITTVVKPFKFSQRTPRRFTSFGTSRHSAAATGVFESSSNDNHASRLRFEATKMKEENRIKHEEDEMLKIMRSEKRRQKLRDSHLHAWQHACSYSAEQDIAMRRQLRHAASILERETFIRDMSCMLSRVRSAPLLLEGGHRLERKQEPCKKHRDEFQKHFQTGTDRPWNKLSTPRLYACSSGGNNRKNTSGNRALSMMDRYGGGGDDKSETLALAEGSLSDSDNESSTEDDDDDDDGGHRHLRSRKTALAETAATDSGSSELDEEEEEGRNEGVHAAITMRAAGDKSNQTNGVNGNRAVKNDDDGRHSLIGTDNDIEDAAEGESDEDDGEHETAQSSNQNGNNTTSKNENGTIHVA